MKLKMHDELISMEIPQKMLELSAIAFSPNLNSINSMKRKFSSNGHHYRSHLTSASSDISSEEHPHAEECEDEDDDSRASSTLVVGNGDLVKADSKLTDNIPLPSPPSSTRSSFDNDGVTRDSFISSGDNSENVADAGHFESFQLSAESDVILEGQSEQDNEQASNADAFDDEIKLVTENLVNMVAEEAEHPSDHQDGDDELWKDVKIDFEGETTLPNGLRIVNGVAEMPFYREDDDSEPPRFTNQLAYLKTLLTKYICRYKTAAAFLNPVDSILYKIPHYYLVIREPMDLNTVKNRINFLWYRNADECISDIRLILSNCFKFNSPTDFVYKSGKRLEEYIEEKLKDMPTTETEIPCPPRPSLDEFQKITTKKVDAIKQRTNSISEISENGDSRGPLTPSIIKMTTRSERGVMVRKPSKDLPTPISTPQPKTPVSRKVPLNEAMKFCHEFVKELFNKKHAEYAWPFWQPVSLQDYPDYLQKIKRPIDLSTIKNNIETGKYLTVQEFASDMRLMISNCYRYNKPESPIIDQARKLRDLFEFKYARIPEEWQHEKLVIHHSTSNGGRHTSPALRSPSASTSTKHQADSHKSSKIKQQHSIDGKTPKARNSVDNSGHLMSSMAPSTSSGGDSRMELLERQVANLTSALKVCLGGVNESTRNAVLDAMLPATPTNTVPATNGKKSKAGRPRKNGLTPSTSGKASGKKQSAASKKRKRHLSSDEDSDSDDEMSQFNNVAEPFDATSIQDLAKLKNDLENLKAKDLKMVLDILQSSEPSIQLDGDTNVEIDFESLKPKTLIALRKFVTSVMLNMKPNRPATTTTSKQPTPSAANSGNKRLCLSNSLQSVSNINTDCDNSTINNWSRAGSRASDLQLSESSSSDSELDD